MPLRLWLGVIVIVATGCDCGGESAVRTCTATSDCNAGELCLDGHCQPQLDGGPMDGGPTPVDACAVSCGSACCGPAQRCFRDRCIEDVGTCVGMTACQDDSACVDEVCVRYGTDPVGDRDLTCTREPDPLAAFEAEIQCEWPAARVIDTPASTSVRIPPLVADLDGDDVPEIVFTTWNAGAVPYQQRIRAIRGDDCAPLWTTDYDVDMNQQLALGDLDGDGRPEICGRGSNYDSVTWPFCLHQDGTLFWEGHDATGRVRVAAGHHDVGINIANVDGAGGPEVVVGLAVFDGATGMLLRTGPEATRGMGSWPASMPAVADVDGDGHLEAVTGGRVYDLVTGELVDWGTSDGFVALAELDATHAGPEVVVVNNSAAEIRVQAIDGTMIWSHAIPGGSGGPPTVADLDGDGQAEFQSAGMSFLTAFDLDCVDRGAGVDPARCATAGATDGVMWSVPTHEFSSGFTGSSVFDFEGDGAVEIVYGDECWTRVFDGRTGAVKFSAAHESITGIEYPVVADVDGDFYTEIVAPHEAYGAAACPMTDPLSPSTTREARRYAGITVLRDRTDRWAPSRPLWSQHSEHFDQRLDDGTVPLVETPSWLTHNSYRQALPRAGGTAVDSPDLTVGDLQAAECDEAAMTQPLSASVCDRGTLPVGAGVVVSFRRDTADGPELCSAMTTGALDPGRCERVACVWAGVPLSEAHDVVAVVDPPDGVIAECHEDDNTGALNVACPPPFM